MSWVSPSAKIKVSAYELMCRNILGISADILGGPSYVHLCNLVPHFRTIGMTSTILEICPDI